MNGPFGFDKIPLVLLFVIGAWGVIAVIDAVIRAFKKTPPEKPYEPVQPPFARSSDPVRPKAELVLEDSGDPDDVQVSGPIPIVGHEDVSQSKTQPIPTIVSGGTVSGGGGGEKIIVSDHILFSFYQKLTDPKNYDIARLIGATRRYGGVIPPDLWTQVNYAIQTAIFEPHVSYDTAKIQNGSSELRYFSIPRGQAGKTQIDTNVDCSGVIVWSPFQFFFKTVVLRFMGDASKEDRQKVLERGIFRFHHHSSCRMLFELPLSMFAPLNPFDPDPKVFFYLAHEIMLTGNDHIEGYLYLQGGNYGLSKEVTVRFELPGIRSVSMNLGMFV